MKNNIIQTITNAFPIIPFILLVTNILFANNIIEKQNFNFSYKIPVGWVLDINSIPDTNSCNDISLAYNKHNATLQISMEKCPNCKSIITSAENIKRFQEFSLDTTLSFDKNITFIRESNFKDKKVQLINSQLVFNNYYYNFGLVLPNALPNNLKTSIKRDFIIFLSSIQF